MTLAEWLKLNGMTATEFAQKAKLAVSTVTRIINGQRRPDWPTIDKIAELTGGKVTANDLGNVAPLVGTAPEQEFRQAG